MSKIPALLLCLLFLLPGCGGNAPETSPEEAPAPDAPQGPPPWIAASRVQPRGLLRKEPGASDHYLLFTQLTSGTSYLLDRDGKVVHTWSIDRALGPLYLLDDGTLLSASRLAEPPNFRAGGIGGFVEKLDWEGRLLWQWKLIDEERALHHDIEPLPNGNILVIGWEQKDEEDALAVGRAPDLIPEQGLWSEWIAEIEPVGTDDARIVWEWHLWDHLVQNRDPEAANYGAPAEHPHRLDINAGDSAFIDEEEMKQLQALGYIPDNADAGDLPSDFLHMNSIDYHAGLDQILVSLPNIGEVWILDHSTTTEEAKGSTGGRYGHGGDLLYRWGNPSAYGRGDKANQQLAGQHQALWIEDGLPGAGHITVFDNGGDRGWSSVVEFVPPVDADGNYPLAADAAWGPEKPVWIYEGAERETFHAPFISGAVRLANGNTAICSGPQGRFFEVTPAGEIVWEYLNPYHGTVPGWNPPGTEELPWASFRADPVPRDHPGLKGRELKPLDPQPEGYVLKESSGPPPSGEGGQ